MAIAIKPSEIESVDSLGDIDGEEVKIIKTVGGLYLALGRAKRNSNEEVLAAGSHPAIVRYNLEKSYSMFRSSLMKSEGETPYEVMGMSELLPPEMVKAGYDLYSIKKSNESEIMLTKSNIEMLKYSAQVVDDSVKISKPSVLVTKDLAPAVKSVVKAAAVMATLENKEVIKHNGKSYSVKQIVEDL